MMVMSPTKEEVKETIEVTQDELVSILTQIGGTTFVTLITETTPRLLKTKTNKDVPKVNPFWDKENKEWKIRKITKLNGAIGWVYGNSVNYQREREGKETDFEPKERQWGRRIQGTPLVYHKDRYYLETKVENVYDVTYVDLAHKPVKQDEVKQFKKKRSSSRQGLNNEVMLRDYRLDSIRQVRMNNKIYKVNDFDEE